MMVKNDRDEDEKKISFNETMDDKKNGDGG